MKTCKLTTLVALAIMCLFTTSCSKNEEITNTNSKRITFDLTDGLIVTTRASLADEGMTDVLILDYVGTECVQSIRKASTDTDFATPEMELSYGTHTLYFVASKGDNLTYDSAEKTVEWTKVRDTYEKIVTITVDKETASSQSVQLERLNGTLIFQINDMIPTNTDHCVVTMGKYYDVLDLEGECAYIDSEKELSRTVSTTSIAGKSDCNISVATLIYGDENQFTTNVSISFYTSTNALIQTHSIANVPIKKNRKTIISGNYFAGTSTWSISLNSTWDADYNITL